VETVTKPPFAVCDVYGDGQILQEVGDLIVCAVNCHADLVAALEDAIELINDINGCHGCADNSVDLDDSRRKALAAALAKAKENTAHEPRLQQQDLDEETL
jgi:hypothetical protein